MRLFRSIYHVDHFGEIMRCNDHTSTHQQARTEIEYSDLAFTVATGPNVSGCYLMNRLHRSWALEP